MFVNDYLLRRCRVTHRPVAIAAAMAKHHVEESVQQLEMMWDESGDVRVSLEGVLHRWDAGTRANAIGDRMLQEVVAYVRRTAA